MQPLVSPLHIRLTVLCKLKPPCSPPPHIPSHATTRGLSPYGRSTCFRPPSSSCCFLSSVPTWCCGEGKGDCRSMQACVSYLCTSASLRCSCPTSRRSTTITRSDAAASRAAAVACASDSWAPSCLARPFHFSDLCLCSCSLADGTPAVSNCGQCFHNGTWLVNACSCLGHACNESCGVTCESARLLGTALLLHAFQGHAFKVCTVQLESLPSSLAITQTNDVSQARRPRCSPCWPNRTGICCVEVVNDGQQEEHESAVHVKNREARKSPGQ